MVVDINLVDCTMPKHFGHICFSVRAEYSPKLITTKYTPSISFVYGYIYVILQQSKNYV